MTARAAFLRGGRGVGGLAPAPSMARAGARAGARTCFHEADPDMPLARRTAAEGLGTAMLMLAACGAGLAAERAFGPGAGLVLPVLALAIPAALAGLIVAFGTVSGGHFNPLITGLQWLAGERSGRCFAAYAAAQMAGGALGGAGAAWLWGAYPSAPAAAAAGAPLAISEAAASAGLMLVVFGCARSGKAETGPFAVAAWLAAAILALPSTSYANPAVALGAALTAGPVALPAGALAWFWPAQAVGALAALICIRLLFPRPTGAGTPPLPQPSEPT